MQCGLQRPQCAQCINSNRLCTGYQRQHVFIVNQDVPNGNRHAKTSTTVTVATDADPSGCQPEQGPLVPDGIPLGKLKKGRQKLPQPSSVSPVPAYRQMLFDCFMRSYVPVDELGPEKTLNWLGLLTELPNQPPALTTAMLALSLSQIGKINQDEHLSKESLKHYTLGLNELHKALYDPAQVQSDETLAACFLISMYELLECPAGDKYAYATHNKGCARLIQLRGPKAWRKGFAHSLFLAIRPQCVRLGPAFCFCC